MREGSCSLELLFRRIVSFRGVAVVGVWGFQAGANLIMQLVLAQKKEPDVVVVSFKCHSSLESTRHLTHTTPPPRPFGLDGRLDEYTQRLHYSSSFRAMPFPKHTSPYVYRRMCVSRRFIIKLSSFTLTYLHTYNTTRPPPPPPPPL